MFSCAKGTIRSRPATLSISIITNAERSFSSTRSYTTGSNSVKCVYDRLWIIGVSIKRSMRLPPITDNGRLRGLRGELLMPICLDRHPSVQDTSARAKRLRGKSTVEFRESGANCIDIGLINNMPSAALEATERQFHALLDAAGDDILVRLRLYALPDVPRTDLGQRRVSGF